MPHIRFLDEESSDIVAIKNNDEVNNSISTDCVKNNGDGVKFICTCAKNEREHYGNHYRDKHLKTSIVQCQGCKRQHCFGCHLQGKYI